MPLKLLIVDDERVNLILTAKMVEKLGHEAECAPGGRKALELLRTGSFDLALLDLQMPDMNGLELARAIRADETMGPMRELPLVALTALVDRESTRACEQAGMERVLEKPLELDRLRELLREFSSSD